MMLSSVAPPAATGICFRRRLTTCNLGFSAGITSPSTKLSFSTSTSSYHFQKDAVLDKISVHAVSKKTLSYVEVDTKIQDLKSFIEGDQELALGTVSEVATPKNISDSNASSSAKTLSKKGKNPTQLSTSSSQIQKLDFLQVFKYPLRTEAAITQMLECNTLVFIVDKRADKKIIRDAAKNMFKMNLKKVNTSMTPDGTKKAFLMLAKDCNAADIAKKIKML